MAHEFGLISPEGKYHSRERDFDVAVGPRSFHDSIADSIDPNSSVSDMLSKGWVRYHNDAGRPYMELEGTQPHAVRNAIKHIETRVHPDKLISMGVNPWGVKDGRRPSWSRSYLDLTPDEAIGHLKGILKTEHGVDESAERPPGNPEYHRKYEFGLISPTGEYHARERNFNSGYDPNAFHDSIANQHVGRSVSSLLQHDGWVRYHNDMGFPHVQLDVSHPHALRNAVKHVEKIEPHKSVTVDVTNWNEVRGLGDLSVCKQCTSPEDASGYLKGLLKRVHGVDEEIKIDPPKEWEYGMISPDGEYRTGKRRSDWTVGPSRFHDALVPEHGYAGSLVHHDGWVRFHSDMGEPNVHFNPKHKHALLNAMRHVDERIPENTPVVLDSGLGHAGRFRAAADKHDARKILRGMLRDHHGCDVEESINEALGTCKHCGSFFQRSVLKDHVGTCSERGSAPEPAPRRARTPREHPLIKKAKKHFGVTHDPREAGYITPDGQMLDLSGKNDGGDPGHRARDHREISHITPDKLPDDLESDSPTHHMWHFMRETGAVRMSYSPDPRNRFAPASVNVDFMRKPTMAQRQTLARIGRGSELVYDVFHPKTLERLHSDDTGRSSIGSMLSMVDHHLKEDTPRADQLIRQKLEEGRKRQYFFHGTKARLRRGDLVMPASKVEGGKTNYDATDKDYAYAMTRADHALDYAEVSHQEGKPVVYRVRSLGDHEPDPSDDSRGEYVRSRTGFRVMGKVRKP